MLEALERSAMRKIYLRLLPFAILTYLLCYIDRINVSFAALTMRTDLGMSATAFGFATGLFYWGYFIFEVPSNVVMEKVGARIWIARIMITWGILAGVTATVTGSTSLFIFAMMRAGRPAAAWTASAAMSSWMRWWRLKGAASRWRNSTTNRSPAAKPIA